jgi:hypothetical protein
VWANAPNQQIAHHAISIFTDVSSTDAIIIVLGRNKLAKAIIIATALGCSARFWRIWHNGERSNQEDPMDLNELTGNERLIAEQAVLAYQAVKEAVKNAPHGHGMEMIEQAVTEKGFETLRKMIELGASEHSEAQKKGSAAKRAGATTR